MGANIIKTVKNKNPFSVFDNLIPIVSNITILKIAYAKIISKKGINTLSANENKLTDNNNPLTYIYKNNALKLTKCEFSGIERV